MEDKEERPQKPKVLIVDDEETILRMFKNQFRKDYEIAIAGSAEEGLKILDDFEADVVVSDQKMPGMKGVDFLVKVKVKHPHAVRMLLTGYTDAEVAKDAINKGEVTAYIDKPWEREKLRQLINKSIEQQQLVLGKMMTHFETEMQTQFHRDFKDAGIKVEDLSYDEKQLAIRKRRDDFVEAFKLGEKEYVVEASYVLFPRTPRNLFMREIAKIANTPEDLDEIGKLLGDKIEMEILDVQGTFKFWFETRALWRRSLRVTSNVTYSARWPMSRVNFSRLVSGMESAIKICQKIESLSKVSFRGERFRFAIEPVYIFGSLDIRKHNKSVYQFDQFLYGHPTTLTGALVAADLNGLSENLNREKEVFLRASE
ncbi:MAG: response regulator [Candidatus Coatesbacteria bacterium]|nr:response regulator [Candidatus Coatesbacteria bacterium]